jgi:hypothetical protein
MGKMGMGELVVLFVGLAAILALFGWVSRVMERGKRRFEVEKNANRPAPSTTIAKEVKVIEKEKIIERQIVVVRCQFCRKTTPVELRTCEHCGAPQ